MSGAGSPCGACKFLRRKCVRGCVFAPYFCHEQGAAHFAAIHKVFGASNVSKLLANLPVGERCEAAVTISYEAHARLRDPIYGCVSHIFALQQQVFNLQAQLACLKEQASQTPEVQTLLKQEYTSTSYLPQFNIHQIENKVTAFSGYENASIDSSSAGNFQTCPMIPGENGSFLNLDEATACISTLENMQAAASYRWSFREANDLQSVAFGAPCPTFLTQQRRRCGNEQAIDISLDELANKMAANGYKYIYDGAPQVGRNPRPRNLQWK